MDGLHWMGHGPYLNPRGHPRCRRQTRACSAFCRPDGRSPAALACLSASAIATANRLFSKGRRSLAWPLTPILSAGWRILRASRSPTMRSSLAGELNAILAFVEQLAEVEVTEVEPMDIGVLDRYEDA